MSIKNLSKLPKRRVTIDELLGFDDVVEIAERLYSERQEISEAIVITVKGGAIYWETNAMPKSRQLYLLEIAKKELLCDD